MSTTAVVSAPEDDDEIGGVVTVDRYKGEIVISLNGARNPVAFRTAESPGGMGEDARIVIIPDWSRS